MGKSTEDKQGDARNYSILRIPPKAALKSVSRVLAPESNTARVDVAVSEEDGGAARERTGALAPPLYCVSSQNGYGFIFGTLLTEDSTDLIAARWRVSDAEPRGCPLATVTLGVKKTVHQTST